MWFCLLQRKKCGSPLGICPAGFLVENHTAHDTTDDMKFLESTIASGQPEIEFRRDSFAFVLSGKAWAHKLMHAKAVHPSKAPSLFVPLQTTSSGERL